MISEKFTITQLSNGFLAEGSVGRGKFVFQTRREALDRLAEWMDDPTAGEIHRLEQMTGGEAHE